MISRRSFIVAAIALFVSTACLSARAANGADLVGTSWQLVRFESGDGKILKPTNGERYTMGFLADGELAAQIDCNRGHGTWKSAGHREISFGPMALTRAQCRPGQLTDRLPEDLEHVRSYSIKNGHLFLSLTGNGGTYVYERLGVR